MHVKITDPAAPDIVFLGLIFVNLGPLKNLPKINPRYQKLYIPTKL